MLRQFAAILKHHTLSLARTLRNHCLQLPTPQGRWVFHSKFHWFGFEFHVTISRDVHLIFVAGSRQKRKFKMSSKRWSYEYVTQWLPANITAKADQELNLQLQFCKAVTWPECIYVRWHATNRSFNRAKFCHMSDKRTQNDIKKRSVMYFYGIKHVHTFSVVYDLSFTLLTHDLDDRFFLSLCLHYFVKVWFSSIQLSLCKELKSVGDEL